jgi:hypothetical protein
MSVAAKCRCATWALEDSGEIMNRFPFNRLALGAFLALGVASFSGCDTEPVETSRTLEVAALALGPGGFGGGVGASADDLADPVDPVSALANGCGQVWNFGHEALVNTDPAVLARFPMRDVLDQIVALSGATQTDTDGFWSQWWSSQRERLAGDPTDHPFCDDNGGTINSFDIDCPRNESQLADVAPETHLPIALFNRFDLAPLDGSHCGEYRIVYAMDGAQAGLSGRNFVIFEAVLPNPDPGCGVAACREVVERWVEVSEEPDPIVRADLLEEFYFDGIGDFEPVIHPAHYGMADAQDAAYGQGATGQIRTNQFVGFQSWTLREFQLEKSCTTLSVPSKFPSEKTPSMESKAEAQDSNSASTMTKNGAFAKETQSEAKSSKGDTNEAPDDSNDQAEAMEESNDSKGGAQADSSKGLSAGNSAQQEYAPLKNHDFMKDNGFTTQEAKEKADFMLVTQCELLARQVTVKGNPSQTLWDDAHPDSLDYRNDFIAELSSLIPNPDELGNIGLMSDPIWNGGESIASGMAANNYLNNLVTGSQMEAAIDTELVALGVQGTHTAANVADRATANSCAGCHQISAGDDLGNGVEFPANSGGGIANTMFVHVTESSVLSDALTRTGGWLDHRVSVMIDFLDVTCDVDCMNLPMMKNADGGLFIEKGLNPTAGAKQMAPVSTQQGATLGGSTVH